MSQMNQRALTGVMIYLIQIGVLMLHGMIQALEVETGIKVYV